MKRVRVRPVKLVCKHTIYFCPMKMEIPHFIETRSALIERTSDELIEVRFKPGTTLDAAGLGEAILAKRNLCHTGSPDVLMVLPADTEVDIRAVTADPGQVLGPCTQAGRLAFVAEGPLNPKLVEIHLRYHPREQATQVFGNEADARQWLATEAPQPSLS